MHILFLYRLLFATGFILALVGFYPWVAEGSANLLMIAVGLGSLLALRRV